MGMDEFVNTPEFRRTSRNILDDSIKRFFWAAGVFFKGVIDFVTSMVKMVVGK